MQNPKPHYSITRQRRDLCTAARVAVKNCRWSFCGVQIQAKGRLSRLRREMRREIFSDVVNERAMYNAAHIEHAWPLLACRLPIFTPSVG